MICRKQTYDGYHICGLQSNHNGLHECMYCTRLWSDEANNAAQVTAPGSATGPEEVPAENQKEKL